MINYKTYPKFKLSIYSLNFDILHIEISSVRVRINMYVKTIVKYVILLHFYVSFLQKHKNHKNIRLNKIFFLKKI